MGLVGTDRNLLSANESTGIVTYKGQTYKVDEYGGISKYTPIEVGDEVTIGGEHFYVIKKTIENEVSKVVLLAKYNLKVPTTENERIEQQNSNGTATVCPFSNTNYWSSSWTNGKSINLNTYEIPVTSGENICNNAILRAKKYGQDLGGSGRLLTYDEANTDDATHCLFTSELMQKILYGTYEGADKVGGTNGEGYLQFWLGTLYSGNGGNNVHALLFSEYYQRVNLSDSSYSSTGGHGCYIRCSSSC